jgi:hypothetical protein
MTAQVIGALAVGMAWGTCQFYALQKTIEKLPALFWIGATAAGMAISILIIGLINPTAQSSTLLDSITPAVYGAIMGLAIGVCQWLALRPITEKASSWMIWSLAAGAIAGGVFLAYMKILMLQGDEMVGVGIAMISGGIPVSIVYALITGFFFKTLLKAR